MKSVIMPLRSINTQSQKVATIQGSSTIVKLQTKPVLIGSFGSESKILELTHLTRPIPNCLGQVTCQRKICLLISIIDKDYKKNPTVLDLPFSLKKICHDLTKRPLL